MGRKIPIMLLCVALALPFLAGIIGLFVIRASRIERITYIAHQTGRTLPPPAMAPPAEAWPHAGPQPVYAFAPRPSWAIVMFGGLKLLMLLGLLVLPMLLLSVMVLVRRRNNIRGRFAPAAGDQAARLRDMALLAERMEERIINLETILTAQETQGGNAGKLGA